MSEIDQLKREIELLRELNATKDALIEALKNAKPEPNTIYVPAWWPYTYPQYPPPPQPFTVQDVWGVTSGSTATPGQSQWISVQACGGDSGCSSEGHGDSDAESKS